MYSSKMSNNYRQLRKIISKSRHIEITSDISYMMVFSFLYKYCSDSLKEYFLLSIEDMELTLDEALKSPLCLEMFKEDSFHMFGYHISSADFFMDEFLTKKGTDFTPYEFFLAFARNVEFEPESNYEKYFGFIFDAVESELKWAEQSQKEDYSIFKEIIVDVSKLDISEMEFPFENVFDAVCKSSLIPTDHDPEYISSLLSAIILAKKDKVDDAYNPFLNDATLLINLSHNLEWGIRHSYGKSLDKLTYCCSIAKFLFSYFDLSTVFSQLGNPFESVDVAGASFDVIVANIPPITTQNIKRLNINQNLEITKRNKREQIRKLLSSELDIDEDSFVLDRELNMSVEKIINKMDLNTENEFTGEYDVLKDSEYLFLINLIDSLKDDGIMAVAMSQNFLFKNSLETLRKYLTVEKNYIDCIISLPDELSKPKKSEVIVVFRKNKNSDGILFIDSSKDYTTETEKYPVRGLFKRNLLLGKSTVERIIEVITKRSQIDKFSSVVRFEELEKNEFNLTISRYVDTFDGEFVMLDDLKHEKSEITQKIKKLNAEIDEMMDDLGINFS